MGVQQTAHHGVWLQRTDFYQHKVTSRTPEGVQGRTRFASSVWCRTERQETSRQGWLKSSELCWITGPSCDTAGGAVNVWNVLMSWLGAWGCHGRMGLQDGSAGQDHPQFSALWAGFSGYKFLSSKTCMKLQVWKLAMHDRVHSSLLSPFQSKGQLVPQDLSAKGAKSCITKSRMVGGHEGALREAGVMEWTSWELGGNSNWLWLQFVPWQPVSLASCFSCTECSACSCSHCIPPERSISFLIQRVTSWCCWSPPPAAGAKASTGFTQHSFSFPFFLSSNENIVIWNEQLGVAAIPVFSLRWLGRSSSLFYSCPIVMAPCSSL